MRTTTTVILLLVTVAAAGYIYFVERGQPTTNEIAATAHLLAPVEASRVREIKIADAGGESRIERADLGVAWRVTKPFDDRADQGYAAALIGLVASLEIRETVGPAGEIEGVAPFDTGAKEITLKERNDVNLVKVRIGRPAAFAHTVYAQNLLADDPETVYVVRGEALDLLALPVSQMRDPSLLPFNASTIVRALVTGPDGEIELARLKADPAAQWWITKPLTARADNEVVNDIFSLLSTVPTTPLDGPAETNTPPTTRDDTAIRISVWGGSGAAEQAGGEEAGGEEAGAEEEEEEADAPVTIDLLPAGSADAPELRARVSDRPGRFAVPPELLMAFTFMPNDVRDDTLAAVEEAAVNTILVRSPEDPDVLLFRAGERWWLVRHGKQEEANAARIANLIAAVNEHPVLEFTSDAASDLAPYGLDEPFLQVSFSAAELHTTDGVGSFPMTAENSVVLRLGQGEGNRLYANFAGQPFVYTVGPTLITAIPSDPIKWKGLRITGFSMPDLKEITVSEGAEPPLTLNFDINTNQWIAEKAGENLTPTLDRSRADTYAAMLSAFHADDWLTERGEAMGKLETSPSLRIDIALRRTDYNTGQTREESLTLRFAPTGDSRFSRFYYGNLEGQPEVFLIERETYDALTTSLFDEEE